MLSFFIAFICSFIWAVFFMVLFVILLTVFITMFGILTKTNLQWGLTRIDLYLLLLIFFIICWNVMF